MGGEAVTRSAAVASERPPGPSFWLVNPSDETRLAPIGAIGELLIEGPPTLRGSGGGVDVPGGHHPGRRGRIYNTGDQLRYKQDGNLTYMGRREDDQVKIYL
ncbi:hypothetical protein MCOR25_001451 [Pyricularia grisea]|nr:hypothetical protein MCOR25_001451 [Pyricularia grisea]